MKSIQTWIEWWIWLLFERPTLWDTRHMSAEDRQQLWLRWINSEPGKKDKGRGASA